MKGKITEGEKKVKQFSQKCPICNKEIKGYSISQVEYNLRNHKETHENAG